MLFAKLTYGCLDPKYQLVYTKMYIWSSHSLSQRIAEYLPLHRRWVFFLLKKGLPL